MDILTYHGVKHCAVVVTYASLRVDDSQPRRPERRRHLPQPGPLIVQVSGEIPLCNSGQTNVDESATPFSVMPRFVLMVQGCRV
jgi:hypothetical protein